MLTPEQINRYQTLSSHIAMALDASHTNSTVPAHDVDSIYCHEHQTITTQNGRKFILSFDRYGNEGKIAIYGDYPRYQNGTIIHLYETPKPTINISINKTPVRIAADITRRFLPEFNAAYDKCLELIATDDERVAWAKATAQFLTTTFGCRMGYGGIAKQPQDITDTSAILFHPNADKIEISGYTKKISIERINGLDIETAADILNIFAPALAI